MDDAPRRALILAGGGIRVAWQAGVVQALDEAGLNFEHGDGTSGGIFTLGMLLSGVAPGELGARWRSLRVRRFVSLLPWRNYVRLPTDWAALGGSRGIRTGVLPHLGIDIAKINAATGMTGSFNVADFGDKTVVAIPHDEIDLDRLIGGVSLPILMPSVPSGERTWTDAVWIKDANLLEAVRRGCDELWLVWCIGNSTRWGNGALEQYVHMIEMSANGALFGELAQIAELNALRVSRGGGIDEPTPPVVVHVVKPDLPLPLDPDFIAGRISAEALVTMGYRDAWRYLATRSPGGVALDASATKMSVAPLGCRLSVAVTGQLAAAHGEAATKVRVSMIILISDLAAFLADPGHGVDVLGSIERPQLGYLPFVEGTARVIEVDGLRRIVVDATVRIDGDVVGLTMATTVPGGAGALRWRAARRWSIDVGATGEGDAGQSAQLGRPGQSGHGWVSLGSVVRMLYMFEPSGAHTPADRARALKLMTRYVRRR